MNKETKELLQAVKAMAENPKGTEYNSNNSWGILKVIHKFKNSN